MKQHMGFTLLELAIAIALSSLLALALYSTFMQTNLSVASINEATAYDMMVSVLYHQFKKDIYGIAVPQQFLIQLKEAADKKSKQKKDDAQKKEAEADKKQQDKKEQEAKKEKEIPPLKKVFYTATQKDLLKQLTFITRNALAYYTDKEQQDITPLLVRVLYQLKEDQNNPGTYRLLRSQGGRLEPEGYEDEKQVRAYELARNIQKLEVVFYKEVIKKEQQEDAAQEKEAEEPKKDKEAKDKEEQEKERPKEFAAVSTWSTDEIEFGQPVIPAFIEMNITFDLGGGRLNQERFMFMPAVADHETIMRSISPRGVTPDQSSPDEAGKPNDNKPKPGNSPGSPPGNLPGSPPGNPPKFDIELQYLNNNTIKNPRYNRPFAGSVKVQPQSLAPRGRAPRHTTIAPTPLPKPAAPAMKVPQPIPPRTAQPAPRPVVPQYNETAVQQEVTDVNQEYHYDE